MFVFLFIFEKDGDSNCRVEACCIDMLASMSMEYWWAADVPRSHFGALSVPSLQAGRYTFRSMVSKPVILESAQSPAVECLTSSSAWSMTRQPMQFAIVRCRWCGLAFQLENILKAQAYRTLTIVPYLVRERRMFISWLEYQPSNRPRYRNHLWDWDAS